MNIRLAKHGDLVAILPLYNDYIATSTGIYVEEPLTPAGLEYWFDSHQNEGYPVLMVESGEDVLGVGFFSPFHLLSGYRSTVRNGLFLRQGAQGRGIGTALLTALIGKARDLGKHAMVAYIDSENAASLRLHARLEFSEAGRLPQVARKFGCWRDLVIMQRFLDDRV